MSSQTTKILINLILQTCQKHPQCRRNIKDILVIGCGNGSEVVEIKSSIAQARKVIGIDIEDRFDNQTANQADLRIGDVTNLEFDNQSFDLVYSHHVLEHVNNPQKALQEARRVLRESGIFYVGVPNKKRIVGYLGSNVSFKKKVEWNLVDWKMRLSGKFENDKGAHAGFDKTKLVSKLKESGFKQVINLSNQYYLQKYTQVTYLINLIIEYQYLSQFILPSHYFLCVK